MGQHFLELKAARTLSLAQVFRLTDGEAEELFRQDSLGRYEGRASLPEVRSLKPYEFRRKTGALRFECRACKADFSLTSGMIFASHKLRLRVYLAAIAIFVNEVKGRARCFEP